MLVMAKALLANTNDMYADCYCQRQCETGVDIVSRGSPVYTNLRQQTEFVADAL